MLLWTEIYICFVLLFYASLVMLRKVFMQAKILCNKGLQSYSAPITPTTCLRIANNGLVSLVEEISRQSNIGSCIVFSHHSYAGSQ